ncbi:hypothetical protein MRB53_038228 [Persea americana]|nr:hypothetical protein MRB53_038228 [Persea americana]
MNDISSITQQYQTVARCCAAIFTVLDQLHHINRLYQFSLSYFVAIFDSVLEKARQSSGQQDHTARVEMIVQVVVPRRVPGDGTSFATERLHSICHTPSTRHPWSHAAGSI